MHSNDLKDVIVKLTCKNYKLEAKLDVIREHLNSYYDAFHENKDNDEQLLNALKSNFYDGVVRAIDLLDEVWED